MQKQMPLLRNYGQQPKCLAELSNTQTLPLPAFLSKMIRDSVSLRNYDMKNMLNDTRNLPKYRRTILQFNVQKTLPVMIVFSFIITVVFVDWHTKSRVLYISLFLLEWVLHQVIGWLFLHWARSERQRIVLTFSRCTMCCAFASCLQIYYGSDFPVWIIQTYRIQLFCHVFYHGIMMAIVNSVVLSSMTIIFLKLSYSLDLSHNDMCFSGSSIAKFPSEEALLFKIKEIVIAHSIVMTFSLLFSNVTSMQTEQNMKQQIIIQNGKLSNIEKLKFIGSLSHQARNPLNGIVAASQILKHESEKIVEEQDNISSNEQGNRSQSPMESIRRFSQSSSSLIEDISKNANLLLDVFSTSLQLSSLQLGTIQLNIRNFNLLELIESMTSVFYAMALEKGMAVHTFYNIKTLPLYVMGDQVRISQVIMNIISYRINNTEKVPDGYVILSCDKCSSDLLPKYNIKPGADDIFVKIDFEDNGTGFVETEELVETLKAFEWDETSDSQFDQYFIDTQWKDDMCCHRSSEENKTVTDLGFIMSAKLVDKMGGKLLVNTTNGRNIISVLLPLQKGSSEHAVPLEQYGTNGNSNREKPTIEEKMKHLEELFSNTNIETVYIMDRDTISCRKLQRYLKSLYPTFSIRVVNSLYLETLQKEVTSSSTTSLLFYDSEFHNSVTKYSDTIDPSHLITIQMSKRSEYKKQTRLEKPIKLQGLLSALISGLEKKHLRSPEKTERSGYHLRESVENIRALVVDDCSINRKVMQRMLQLIGFEQVDCACNGLEGFEMFKLNSYGLILMDLVMPVSSGKECLTMIRDYEKHNMTHVPIIAATANIWESKQNLQEFGFDGVIYKPILMDVLRNEVERMLTIGTHNESFNR